MYMVNSHVEDTVEKIEVKSMPKEGAHVQYLFKIRKKWIKIWLVKMMKQQNFISKLFLKSAGFEHVLRCLLEWKLQT